jgi:hypothetical protein
MPDTPNIPSLSSKVDPEVKKAFTALKSWLDKVGGLVSAGDLTGTGLFGRGQNGTLTPNAPYLDMTMPPQITGFAVTGAFSAIMLTWDDPRYKNLAYVEVYRATVNDLGVAARVGTTQSAMYADKPPLSSLSVTYYYWVRIVSVASIKGPYNAIAGTPGSTADDPTYVLEILTGQIKKGQLYGDLASRIDLIDAPGSGLQTIISDLADNQLEFIARQYNEQFLGLMREQNISSATVHVDPLTGQISLLATANVTTDIEARISDLEFNVDAPAGSLAILNHTAVFDRVSVTDFNTAISALAGEVALKTTTSYVDAAMAGMGDNSSPDVADAFSGETSFAIMNMLLMGNKMNLVSLEHKANIATAQFNIKSNSDAISAEATARLDLAAQVVVGDAVNAAALVSEQTARADAISAEATARLALATLVAGNAAAIVTEQSARSTAVDAVASSVSTLQTTVAGHTSSILTQQTSINGIQGEYTIKIDANGVVASVGLINGVGGSSFGVRAGQFFIVDPAAPATQILPFIVSGGKTIMDTALIGNATIKNAMVETLSADKLLVPGTASIWDAIITTGKITNAYIDNVIQSSSYSPGTSGWKVDKGGAVEFNGGTFRGAVVFAAGSSGYANLTDAPVIPDLSTVNSWVKPTTTLIDGNKIYTGDAYVGSAQIQTAAIQTAKIGDLQVTTLKIADLAVGSAKIDNLAVTSAKIGDLQVTTAKIGDNQVTVPGGMYTAAGVSMSAGATISLQSAAINPQGQPVIIDFSFFATSQAINAGSTWHIQILRGATVIYDVAYTLSIPQGTQAYGLTDFSPAAGSNTYTARVLCASVSHVGTISNRSLTLLGAMK